MKTVKGNIYIIAAASGTGKTSLVRVLVESLDNVITSISHTTRPKRSNEIDGENYFFVDQAEFARMHEQNTFFEHAKVFGNDYGTSRTWVEQQLNKGLDVILEIDWQGAEQIKTLIPSSISIFILPPSIAELQRRINSRNQDSEKIITNRLAAAHEEIAHCKDFDYIVINDKFDVALVDLRSIIRSQRLFASVQLQKQQKLVAELTQKG